MKKTFSLRIKDCIAFSLYQTNRKKNFIQRNKFQLLMLVFIVFIVSTSGRENLDTTWPFLLFCIAFIIFQMTSIGKRFTSVLPSTILIKSQIKENPSLIEERTITKSEQGINVETKNSISNYTWEEIKSIEQDSNNVYLYISDALALVIPKRIFESEKQIEEFISR